MIFGKQNYDKVAMSPANPIFYWLYELMIYLSTLDIVGYLSFSFAWGEKNKSKNGDP